MFPKKPQKHKNCGVVFNYRRIPAEMGGDQHNEPYEPKQGLFYNEVVYYEKTGATYIFTSDGIAIPIVNVISSVNGKKGKVVLTTKDLENDSNYQTPEDVARVVSENIDKEANERIREDLALRSDIDNIINQEITADEVVGMWSTI